MLINQLRNLKQQANKYRKRKTRGFKKKFEANQAANNTVKLTQSTFWLLSCWMECFAKRKKIKKFVAFLHVKAVLIGAVEPEIKPNKVNFLTVYISN